MSIFPLTSVSAVTAAAAADASLRERTLEPIVRAAGKETQWNIFERQVRAELGLPTTQVTNFLAMVRRTFRRILLDRLREQCATSAEHRDEAREPRGDSVV